jgi:phosphoenolpyruvate carboxykinase (GTP)
MFGIMSGATMVVGLYIRGPVGAAASNPALEITSSAYVSHSAEILYRNAFGDFEKEVERLGHFYTNLHSEGLNRSVDLPNARVFMDRSHRTTYSFNCTYAGNTLLLKKGNHRFSVDKAVYAGNGKELAEHMFITGIEGPNGPSNLGGRCGTFRLRKDNHRHGGKLFCRRRPGPDVDRRRTERFDPSIRNAAFSASSKT